MVKHEGIIETEFDKRHGPVKCSCGKRFKYRTGCERHLKQFKDKEVMGIIKFIAEDDRRRVSMEDQIKWLEEKLAEIARLANSLPYKGGLRG